MGVRVLLLLTIMLFCTIADQVETINQSPSSSFYFFSFIYYYIVWLNLHLIIFMHKQAWSAASKISEHDQLDHHHLNVVKGSAGRRLLPFVGTFFFSFFQSVKNIQGLNTESKEFSVGILIWIDWMFKNGDRLWRTLQGEMQFTLKTERVLESMWDVLC